MRKTKFALLAAVAVVAGAVPARGTRQPALPAQNPPAKATQDVEKSQQPIRVGVSLVNIYATVRDGKKRIVPDMRQEEFRIFEDDKEQKVAFFSKETALPVTLGLLIDTSISQEGVLRAEQQAASRFLSRVMRKGDLAFIASFDVNVDLLSDYTEDHAQLERALNRARINSPGMPGPFSRGRMGTVFYDAIYVACKEKLASEVGRKAIVVMTDADDAGSKLGIQDAIDAAQRSDTVVHIIGISDGGFPGEGPAKKISEQTGGRTLNAYSEKKLEEAFDQIVEELRTQYTLGYYPENTARDGKFRKLRVEVTRKGSKVLTRRGYYAATN
jgi:VWFA-related protein